MAVSLWTDETSFSNLVVIFLLGKSLSQPTPPPMPILSQTEAKNPRINQLSARWQQVWLLALERQRKLNDALDRLEEVRSCWAAITGGKWLYQRQPFWGYLNLTCMSWRTPSEVETDQFEPVLLSFRPRRRKDSPWVNHSQQNRPQHLVVKSKQPFLWPTPPQHLFVVRTRDHDFAKWPLGVELITKMTMIVPFR